MTRLVAIAGMVTGLFVAACGGGGGGSADGPSDGAAADVGAADVPGGNAADAADAFIMADPCPTMRPKAGQACTTAFDACTFNESCVCGKCCSTTFGCVGGVVKTVSYRDDCFGGGMCPADGGAADGASDAKVCTPDANQTCNDNPAISSIHGTCTAAGTCTCGTFELNPATGRCK